MTPARLPMAASISHTVIEGEKGENGTRSSAETEMDGGKWKRWSDGEENCQSVKQRKPRKRKALENERRCEDWGSDFQVT